MRRKLLICAGALLLAAAVGLTAYNLREDYLAGVRAAQVVAELRRDVAARTAPSATPAPSQTPDPAPSPSPRPTGPMPAVTVDGHDYIGTLEIPALELSLPILDAWSYPNLKLAPCRYSGSAYLDSLIIAGHNYRAHFGHLKDLQPGNAVRLTDVEGNCFSYAVAALEQLAPTAVDELEAGRWDLTLFTCTPDGMARLAVRCQRAADSPETN